ncbi:MAG: MerR family transcriptional regulator [Pseudomonadota bacterium]
MADSGGAAGRQSPATEKSPDAFRTISEVSEELDLPQHVLRFWETRFSQIRPLKRGGGRRLYRPDHISLLRGIKALLYDDGMTIKGVQKVLRERGQKAVMARGRADATLGFEATVPSDATGRLAALRERIETMEAAGEGAKAKPRKEATRRKSARPAGAPTQAALDFGDAPPPADGSEAAPESPQDAPEKDERVEASINRLKSVLQRLEGE